MITLTKILTFVNIWKKNKDLIWNWGEFQDGMKAVHTSFSWHCLPHSRYLKKNCLLSESIILPNTWNQLA